MNSRYFFEGERLFTGKQEIPVVWKGDVIVAGGGTSGVTAAAASARRRARTIVVEKNGFLGGMASYASGMPIDGAFPGYISLGGMMDELLAKLRFAGMDSASMRDVEHFGVTYYHEQEYFKFLTGDILIKSGCEILLHSVVTDVIMDGTTAKGVIIESVNGTSALLANAVIDCTGDAGIVTKAGGTCIKGDNEGRTMALSFPFIIGNADTAKANAFIDCDYKLENTLIKARSEGNGLNGDDEPWLLAEGLRPNTFFADTIRLTGYDPTDAAQLTKAEIEARRRLFNHLEFFRKYVPGMENIFVIRSSDRVVARESRRIAGEETLTMEDCINLRKFPNGILRSSGPLYELTRKKNSKGLDSRVRVLSDDGGWFEVPYGAIVPKGLDNVLVAGKCISADAGALSGLGIAQMMVIGQAAGIAGAIVAARGIRACEIDGRMLRSMLDEVGCDIDGDKTRKYPGDMKTVVKGLNINKV